MVRMVGYYFGRHPIVGRIFYERTLENEMFIAAAEIAVEKIGGRARPSMYGLRRRPLWIPRYRAGCGDAGQIACTWPARRGF